MGEVIPFPSHNHETYWQEQLEIAERKVAYAKRMLAKTALNTEKEEA